MKFIKIFIIILFKKKPTLADIYKHWISVRSAFTFIPTSIGGKSTKGQQNADPLLQGFYSKLKEKRFIVKIKKTKIKDWLINIKTKGAKTLVSVKPSTKTAESFLNDSINYYNSPRSYYQAYCNCKHFLLPSGAIHWGW